MRETSPYDQVKNLTACFSLILAKHKVDNLISNMNLELQINSKIEVGEKMDFTPEYYHSNLLPCQNINVFLMNVESKKRCSGIIDIDIFF